jgi:hypothetical protein
LVQRRLIFVSFPFWNGALFIDGVVSRKFVEQGKHLVEISQKARTHRDELSATGASIVELPSRG